jgi:hypothetical protein
VASRSLTVDRGASRGVEYLRSSAGATRARRKFLRFFPNGFQDETYVDWERDYKWGAHESWMDALDRATFRRLLEEGEFAEIAARAVHASLLEFADTVRRDVRDMKPRDMIDIQSFIWVQGSDEYEE